MKVLLIESRSIGQTLSVRTNWLDYIKRSKRHFDERAFLGVGQSTMSSMVAQCGLISREYAYRKLFNYLDNNPHYIERFRLTALADEIFFLNRLGTQLDRI